MTSDDKTNPAPKTGTAVKKGSSWNRVGEFRV